MKLKKSPCSADVVCVGQMTTKRISSDIPGASSAGPKLLLLPETDAMADLLVGVLAEHNISFDCQDGLILTSTPGGKGRTVALLRQVLSEPARRAVGVVGAAPNGFPVSRHLDDWWRMNETVWFDRALAEDRFETWFQPVVDTTENRVFAHECLVRLNGVRLHSGREIVEAAKLRGELQSFDGHARRLALRCAARVSGKGKFFVNFVPATIYSPDSCVREVCDELELTGLQRRQIVLEAVDAELVTDRSHLRRIADHCRRNDIGFSLDDVDGASLRLIMDLKPDFVKLHRRLVEDIERPAQAATVRRLVSAAGQSGSLVVAKGVEKTRTMESLWLLGVQCMQGYLFGRPVPGIDLWTGTSSGDLLRIGKSLGTPASGPEPGSALSVDSGTARQAAF